MNRPESALVPFHRFAAASALAESSVRLLDATLALDADRPNRERATYGEAVVYRTAIGTHGGGRGRYAPTSG